MFVYIQTLFYLFFSYVWNYYFIKKKDYLLEDDIVKNDDYDSNHKYNIYCDDCGKLIISTMYCYEDYYYCSEYCRNKYVKL
jgi:hypothetical protein